MDKNDLIRIFSDLNNIDFETPTERFSSNLELNISRALEALQIDLNSIHKQFKHHDLLLTNQDNASNYICIIFYILEKLGLKLSESPQEMLTVNDTKHLKKGLKNAVLLGIIFNIEPTLPITFSYNINPKIKPNYNLLKFTLLNFHKHINHRPELRLIILPECLKGILLALFYIPCTEKNNISIYREIFTEICNTTHLSILTKQIMLLFQPSAPEWLGISITKTLTNIMHRKKGVFYISTTMLDGCENDTTKTWKTIDILTRIIGSRCNSKNICAQLTDLIDENESETFERLFVSCAKYFHEKQNPNYRVLIQYILNKFERFPHQNFPQNDATEYLNKNSRLLRTFFVDSNLFSAELQNIIGTLLYLYQKTSKLKTLHNTLKEVILVYLKTCDLPQFFDDTFLKIQNCTTRPHLEVVGEKITVNSGALSEDSPFECLNLLSPDQKFALFEHLTGCITNKKRYFTTEFECSDENARINLTMERLVNVHALLTQLSNDEAIQKYLKERPEAIIEFARTLFKTRDGDTIFIVVMILNSLTENCTNQSALDQFKTLTKDVEDVITCKEIENEELKSCCLKLLRNLASNTGQNFEENSELEQALLDVCDGLLPVRGHGLMTLTKLIAKRDKDTLAKKQYILNLFQLSLKDSDSYIYLIAAQGLASLADQFPDTVLEVLCDEYATFSTKMREQSEENAILENRMKLGEVLVRATKQLGDGAGAYKSVLLNTFLATVKDPDYLMRASSLSNLGEVCRVLGSKLGTIINEILMLVHDVIATDDSPEPKRAAVSVLRQIFVRLNREMVPYLRSDLRPILHTLRAIYSDDKDDVMRLQAQLALEEFSESFDKTLTHEDRTNLLK